MYDQPSWRSMLSGGATVTRPELNGGRHERKEGWSEKGIQGWTEGQWKGRRQAGNG